MDKRRILTVRELTALLSSLIEGSIGYVYVRGEVSNLKVSDVGHAYFTIKDEVSQISAVLFRGQNIRLNFKDGSRIIVGGTITIYPPKSVYQIVVREVILDGLGELYLKFEELKRKLYEKGLFAEEVKRSIPEFNFHIGLITSPYGAAVRDFLKTAYKKNPFIKITIYPAKVQGEEAPIDIISGIEYFNRAKEVDVIVIVRGGGSFEDLFCFNDENLAYAIRGSEIPVVTGIGHEIDYTIADYVADHREATPTAAAEYTVRSFAEIIDRIEELYDKMDTEIRNMLLSREMVVKKFFQLFYRDKEAFDEKAELLNSYLDRIGYALRDSINRRYDSINRCARAIERSSPAGLIRRYADKVELMELRYNGAILNYLNSLENAVNNYLTKIELLNPENLLKKGYSVVYKGDKIVKESAELEVSDLVKIVFYRGRAVAEIKKKE